MTNSVWQDFRALIVTFFRNQFLDMIRNAGGGLR